MIICVTSDKCYHNTEQIWGYREEDAMGGEDPYSASRRRNSCLFNVVLFSTGQQGRNGYSSQNVIGGGDFFKNRIMTVFRAYKIEALQLRNPRATRPGNTC